MLYNQAYEDYIENFGDVQVDYYKDFDTDEAWAFFSSVEEDYNCAGMCYTPLFFLSKDISAGRPEKECIRELIDDVYTESKDLFNGVGLCFLFCAML